MASISNIQFYWDGDSGVCTHGGRRAFFTEKPEIVGVEYDKVTYNADVDNLKIKVLKGVTKELTDAEVNAIKLFCDVNAKETVGDTESIYGHNTDPTAHHDIRVELSNLNEGSHRVASVWSTEVTLSDQRDSTFLIPWDYVVGDLTDCTVSTDSTKWRCPVSELYDITVRLGFEGLNLESNVSVTLTLLKNDTEVLATGTHTFTAGSAGLPSVELSAVSQVLSEGDTISVRCSMPVGYGLIVPSRSFLVVDNHGLVMGKRQADFIFNTMANFVFFNGYEATLNGDANGVAQIIASKWSPEVIDLTPSK